MTQEEFDNHTPYTFQLALEGFQQLQLEREKSEWNRTRWATWQLINIQIEDKLKRPTDLILFEWEKETLEEKEKIDPAIIERLENAFDNHAKNNP